MHASSLPLSALLAAALLFIGGLNPDHFPPWTSFHAEAPAFAASAVLLLAVVRRDVRFTAALAWIGVLLVSVWVQFAFGLLPYAGDAWTSTAYLLAFGAAWLWGQGMALSGRSRLPAEVVCVTLVLLALAASFQALAQWLQLAERFGGWVFDGVSVRASGNWGQPNQAGTLFMMATAATAFLLLQGRLSRSSAWPLALLFGGCAILTQSRTAMLSAGVMFAVVMLAERRFPALKPIRWDACAWIVVIYGGAWAFQFLSWDALGTRAVGAGQMVQVGLRPLLWRQLSVGLGESPWVGYGWLQVASAQQVGALAVPGLEQTNYAHNAVLDALLFLGVPAGLVMTALAFAWLIRRVVKVDSTSAGAAAGLLVLLPWAVHTQLELPHAYAYFLVPVGMLLGAFDAATGAPHASVRRIPRAAVAALSAGWLVLLGALAFEYMLVEEDFRVNRFENRRLGKTPEDYHPPELRMLTHWGETLQAMRLRARPGMAAEDLELLVRTSRRFTWAPLHYRTALALALNGRPQDAGRQLRVIQAMFPSTVWEEGRADWIRMREEEYPQLAAVDLP